MWVAWLLKLLLCKKRVSERERLPALTECQYEEVILKKGKMLGRFLKKSVENSTIKHMYFCVKTVRKVARDDVRLQWCNQVGRYRCKKTVQEQKIMQPQSRISRNQFCCSVSSSLPFLLLASYSSFAATLSVFAFLFVVCGGAE